MKCILKRFVAFLMMLIMLTCSFSTSAYAATNINTYSREADDGSVTVGNVTIDKEALKLIEEYRRQQIDKSDEANELEESFNNTESDDAEDITYIEQTEEDGPIPIYDEDSCTVLETLEPNYYEITDEAGASSSANVHVVEYGTANLLNDYSFSCENGMLEITKDGYYPIKVSTNSVGVKLDPKNDNTFTLVPKTVNTQVVAAFCDGIDIFSQNKSIKTNETKSIYVVVSEDTIKDDTVKLFSENKSGWTNNNMTYNFDVDTQSDMYTGKVGDSNVVEIKIEPKPEEAIKKDVNKRVMIGVSAYNKAPYESRHNKTSLKTNFQISKKKTNFDFKLTDKLQITLPKSVPVVGNSTFEIGLDKLPVALDITDESVQIAVNTTFQPSKNPGEWDKKFNECKKAYEDMRHPIQSAYKKQQEDFMKAYSGSKFQEGLGSQVKLTVGGYIEFDWDDEGLKDFDGGVVIMLDANIGGEWQLYAGSIPIVISASIGVDGTLILGFDVDIKSGVWYFNGEVQFDFPVIQLSCGVGLARVASISVYGKFSNELHIKMTKGHQYSEFALNGEAGVSLKVFFFKWSKALVKGRYVYYRDSDFDNIKQKKNPPNAKEPEALYNRNFGVFDITSEEMFDESNYYIDRSYLEDQGEFEGEMENIESVSNTGLIDSTLKKGVYFSAAPKMAVTDNGTKVLVWTEDIRERTTGNHTAIVYSVYSDVNEKWSDPVIIDDNKTLDTNPEVLVQNNKIYVAWINSSEAGFTESSEISDIAKTSDIEVVEFDTTGQYVKLSAPSYFGLEGKLDMMPHLFADNGSAFVAYVSNSNSDAISLSGTNTVHCVNLSSANKEDKEVISLDKPIHDFRIGEISGEQYLAYIADEDGDASTYNDHNVYTKKLSDDASVRVSGNCAMKASVQFNNIGGKDILTWVSEGKLCYSENGTDSLEMEQEGLVSEDYLIDYFDGSTVLFTLDNDEKENGLFLREIEGNKLGKPVRITDPENSISSYSTVVDGTTLYTVYLDTNGVVTSDGVAENSNLRIIEIKKDNFIDIDIKQFYHDEKLVKNNAVVPVTFHIKNNGLNKVEGFKYYIYKKADDISKEECLLGTKYKPLHMDANISVGEEEQFTVNVPVGELAGTVLLGMRITPDAGKDVDYDDSIETEMAFADLTMNATILTSVYSYFGSVEVSNEGALDTKAYLNIREGKTTGRVMATYFLGSIGAGEKEVYELPAEIMNSLEFNRETLVFEAASTANEKTLSNNYDIVHVETVGYHVNFDPDGGEVDVPYIKKVKLEGESVKYGVLPIPKKDGYVFNGWINDEGAVITEETEYTRNEDEVLKAQWIEGTCTVSFETGIGVKVPEIQVTYTKPYGQLPSPVLPDREFKGWFIDEKQGIENLGLEEFALSNDIGTPIKADTIVSIPKDHTLYAKYEYKNTVIAPEFLIDNPGVKISENEIAVPKGTRVSLKTDTRNATIYYTTDRTDPNPESPLYDNETGTKEYIDSIVIDNKTTVKAIAVRNGYKNSDIVSINYSILDESGDWGDVIEKDRVQFDSADDVPAGIWISGVEDKLYTGKKITQDFRVYFGKTRLIEKKDYTVKYKDNVNSGCAMVYVSGKGDFSGNMESSFLIMPRNLGLSFCEAEDIYAQYNGKLIKGKTDIIYNIDGKLVKLKEGKDYKYVYPETNSNLPDYNSKAFIDEGDYSVIVEGIGNYSGKNVFNERITKKPLINKASVKKISDKPYTGSGISVNSSEFFVKLNGKDLTYGTDYTVKFKNNVDIGKATVYIYGKNEYSGVKKTYFNITGTKINSMEVDIDNSEVFKCDAINPKVKVHEKGSPEKLLNEGTDYTVSFENNINAGGNAKVVITGKGMYTGVLKKSFKILPYDISTDPAKRISINNIGTVSYEKGGNTPNVVVKDTISGNTLKAGVDYTVKYINNKVATANAAGKKPTVVITGKGNYKGTISAEFDIQKRNLSISNNGVMIFAKDLIYKDGIKLNRTTVKLTDLNGKVLSPGTDYKKITEFRYLEDTLVTRVAKDKTESQVVRLKDELVDKDDILPFGANMYANIEGINNYEGSSKAIFSTVLDDISKAKVTVKPMIYTGKKIVVTKNDITSIALKKDVVLTGTDYDIVAIRNSIRKGKGQIILRGKGIYGGEKTVSFTILPRDVID